ncbi:receptor-like proteiny region, transmembrane domain and RING domain-containing protein 1-like [Gossypium australe]|uniref:Receptor-like proteiny region, transmembrane domain and RING domain-containing protein 1-like n=1 Tax=Gossypium australe TaxID=47621 RepID=A0A5B6VZT0_9ROSI|nr:receptor-like proteiny region, transmembrane domain and RING domain-containing protein 1-like [Gossypium australe]
MTMREALLGFSILLIFIAYFIEFSSAIVVFEPFSISFPDLPAKFGNFSSSFSLFVYWENEGKLTKLTLSSLISRGNNTAVCGALQVADPSDACTPLRNEFGSNKTGPTRFALIIRGNCSFEEKIRKAQSGGFSAAIVYDDQDRGSLVSMMANPKGIKILAVFVSKSAGEFLKDHAKGEKGECCIYLRPNSKALTIFVICFLSLLVIAAFLVIALMPPRILSNWRRRNLVKSVDSKTVEALPCVAFGSARLSQCHTGETCAICLEDYKDGEILKILPCQHGRLRADFHSSCVESWLTKWGTFCPVCKHDMITKAAYSEVSEQRPSLHVPV